MSQSLVWIILAVNVGLTVAGDALIKKAAAHPNGLASLWFMLGVVAYATPVFGWFYLMRELTLIEVGVLYSATTLVLLTAVAALVFHEPLSLRSIVSVALALAAMLVGGRS